MLNFLVVCFMIGPTPVATRMDTVKPSVSGPDGEMQLCSNETGYCIDPGVNDWYLPITVSDKYICGPDDYETVESKVEPETYEEEPDEEVDWTQHGEDGLSEGHDS